MSDSAESITHAAQDEIQSHSITVEVTREDMIELLKESDVGLMMRASKQIEFAADASKDLIDGDGDGHFQQALELMAVWDARRQEEYDLE